MPSVTTVPGRWPLIGHTVTLLRSPVEFLSSLPARGDVVRVFLGPLPVHLVTTPELALQLLTSDKFDKGIVFDKMRPLFGNGLATSNGAFNQRQRRMMLPAFTRTRVATYAENVITSLATELRDSWHDGQRLEFDRVMQDFVMTVAGRTLFSAELGQQVLDEIKHSIPIMLKHVLVRAFSPSFVEKLPLKANREFDEAAARLRKVIPEVVVGARREGGDHGDLLSALLAARDADTGEAMTDEQIHDEVVTILTTGAETTAVALAWFFHEVGTRPDVRQRFHAEVDAVLGDRPATFEDVAKLEYTGRIINEVLRRTPPIIGDAPGPRGRRDRWCARAEGIRDRGLAAHSAPRSPVVPESRPVRPRPVGTRQSSGVAEGRVHPVRRRFPFLPRTFPRPHGDRDRGRDDRDPVGPRSRCETTCLRPGEGDHAAQQAARDRHE